MLTKQLMRYSLVINIFFLLNTVLQASELETSLIAHYDFDCASDTRDLFFGDRSDTKPDLGPIHERLGAPTSTGIDRLTNIAQVYTSAGRNPFGRKNTNNNISIDCFSGNAGNSDTPNSWYSNKYTNGRAVRFSGSDNGDSALKPYTENSDYLAVNEADYQSFTIGFWMKLDMNQASYSRVVKLIGHDNNNDVLLYVHPNQTLSIKSKGVNYHDNQVIADDRWHHVVLQGTGNNLSLYIDGESTALSIPALNSSIKDFYLASDETGYRGIKGSIDDLQIFDKPLDIVDRKKMITSTPSIVAEWGFDQDSDEGTASNHQWQSNIATAGSINSGNRDSQNNGTWASAQDSFFLNNTNSLKFTPSGNTLLDDAYTVSWWAKTNSAQANWSRLACLDFANANETIRLYFDNENSLAIKAANALEQTTSLTESGLSQKWHMYSIVLNNSANNGAGQLTLYVDGEYQAQIDNYTTPNEQPIISLGTCAGPSKSASGFYDNLRVVNAALNEPELGHLMRTSGATTYSVEQQNTAGWGFFNEGQRFVIKGAAFGDNGYLTQLSEIGGNAVRTYDHRIRQRQDSSGQGPLIQSNDFLDEAYRKNIGVAMGLQLTQARFAPWDEIYLAAESTTLRPQKYISNLRWLRAAAVDYANHPAIAMWGLGNELSISISQNENPAQFNSIWSAVADLNSHIKQFDNRHPTYTSLAGNKPEAQIQIKNKQAIDILALNAYSNISLTDSTVKNNWNGPYMLTEWGDNITQSASSKTFPPEPTVFRLESDSNLKYYRLRARYNSYIKPHLFPENSNISLNPKDINMGSFIFRFQQTSHAPNSHTWHNLILKPSQSSDYFPNDFTGSFARTTSYDALSTLFGNSITNPAPRARDMQYNGMKESTSLQSSECKIAQVIMSNQGSNLKYKWIFRNALNQSEAPDFSAFSGNSNAQTLCAPNVPGIYRLFVYVLNTTKDAIGTANMLVEVK